VGGNPREHGAQEINVSIVTDTERRTNAGAGLRVTSQRRQPRPADPDLQQLDRRLTALEALGDTRSRAWAVALLRRSWQHLDRDKAQRIAGWYSDAASLEHAIRVEEAVSHA